jgi:DNA-binding MarR family transcriptional regulator
MKREETTLEDLLIDEGEQSEELLTGLLENYVRIGEQSGELIPEPAFQELSTKQKTAITLLTQRAKQKLNVAESEWLSPSEISAQSGVKKGTVYPIVRTLEDEGIAENEDGNYRIPGHGVRKVQQLISGGDDE